MRAFILYFFILLVACDEEGKTAPIHEIEKSEVKSFSFSKAHAPALLSKNVLKSALKLGPSIRMEACHRYFEPGGEVVNSLPTPETHDGKVSFEAFLASCGPEAYLLGEDFIYVAYGYPSDNPNGQDLRVLKFDAKTGNRIWAHEMDRSENAKNYIANFRGSFLTPVEPNKICAGTLWEGGTQTICIDEKSGDKIWDGRIPTWSGIEPVGGHNGLFVAGLSAITKRYPYSGTEMEYLKLAGLGGRSAFFITTKTGMFFSSGRTMKNPELYFYSFEPLAIRWKLEIPVKPDPTFGRFVNVPAKDDPENGVLVVRLKGIIAGISTNGNVLWKYKIGVGRPSITSQGSTVFLVHRQKTKPNVLVRIDAQSGKILGKSALETGLLKAVSVGNKVFLKGIRAVRRLEVE